MEKKFSLRTRTVVGAGPLTSFLPLPRAWNLEYLGYFGDFGHLGYLGYLGIPQLVGAGTSFPLPREELENFQGSAMGFIVRSHLYHVVTCIFRPRLNNAVSHSLADFLHHFSCFTFFERDLRFIVILTLKFPFPRQLNTFCKGSDSSVNSEAFVLQFFTLCIQVSQR